MKEDTVKLISCGQCEGHPCLRRYPDGLPQWCQSRNYQEIIEATKTEFLKPENMRIHVAAGEVIKKGNNQWTRVQETIQFAKELGVHKVGIAFCVGLHPEARELTRYFQQAGFDDTVAVGCTIGGLKDTDTGLPVGFNYPYPGICNPIAQAEILNKENTELNVVVGLCTGHDALFIKYSDAPVTVFAVKDRVTCNNPSAVLFSPYHRLQLNQLYKEKGNK